MTLGTHYIVVPPVLNQTLVSWSVRRMVPFAGKGRMSQDREAGLVVVGSEVSGWAWLAVIKVWFVTLVRV